MMMRPLIHRYVRLKRRVNGWWVLLAAGLCIILVVWVVDSEDAVQPLQSTGPVKDLISQKLSRKDAWQVQKWLSDARRLIAVLDGTVSTNDLVGSEIFGQGGGNSLIGDIAERHNGLRHGRSSRDSQTRDFLPESLDDEYMGDERLKVRDDSLPIPFYVYDDPQFTVFFERCKPVDEGAQGGGGHLGEWYFANQAFSHKWRVRDPEDALVFVVPVLVGIALSGGCERPKNMGEGDGIKYKSREEDPFYVAAPAGQPEAEWRRPPVTFPVFNETNPDGLPGMDPYGAHLLAMAAQKLTRSPSWKKNRGNDHIFVSTHYRTMFWMRKSDPNSAQTSVFHHFMWGTRVIGAEPSFCPIVTPMSTIRAGQLVLDSVLRTTRTPPSNSIFEEVVEDKSGKPLIKYRKIDDVADEYMKSRPFEFGFMGRAFGEHHQGGYKTRRDVLDGLMLQSFTGSEAPSLFVSTSQPTEIEHSLPNCPYKGFLAGSDDAEKRLLGDFDAARRFNEDDRLDGPFERNRSDRMREDDDRQPWKFPNDRRERYFDDPRDDRRNDRRDRDDRPDRDDRRDRDDRGDDRRDEGRHREYRRDRNGRRDRDDGLVRKFNEYDDGESSKDEIFKKTDLKKWQGCYTAHDELLFGKALSQSMFALFIRGDDWCSSRLYDIIETGSLIVSLSDGLLDKGLPFQCNINYDAFITSVPEPMLWRDGINALRALAPNLTATYAHGQVHANLIWRLRELRNAQRELLWEHPQSRVFQNILKQAVRKCLPEAHLRRWYLKSKTFGATTKLGRRQTQIVTSLKDVACAFPNYEKPRYLPTLHKMGQKQEGFNFDD